MPEHRIFETAGFSEDLKKIARSGMSAIINKLQNYVYPQLKRNPYFGPHIRRLQNWEPSTWRYRVADWRFFYQISEEKKIVFMIAASHRSEAYRK